MPTHGSARRLGERIAALNPAHLHQRRQTTHDVVKVCSRRFKAYAGERRHVEILLEKNFAAPLLTGRPAKPSVVTDTSSGTWFRRGVLVTFYPETCDFCGMKSPQGEAHGSASSRSSASTGRSFLLPRGLFSRSTHAWTGGDHCNGSGPLNKFGVGT